MMNHFQPRVVGNHVEKLIKQNLVSQRLAKSWLYFFLIPFLFYLIFIILSKKWWLFTNLGGAETNAYILSSSYVDKIWKGILQIKNFQDFFQWLMAFFFHLSPFDFCEKPLFIMGLGYFSLIYHLFPKGIPLPADALFNILLMLISGYLIFMIFYDLKESFFGILAVGLVFLNIGLTIYSLNGYHTTFGIFIFLLLVYFYSKWQLLTPKRAFILGILLSFTFFSSHHVILLCIPSFIFICFQIYKENKEKQVYFIKNLIFLIMGVLTLFIYFSLRDFMFSIGFFDKYRQPELALYLQQIHKYIPFVFKSLLRRMIESSVHRNYPQDILYFYYYLKDMEGLFFLPFLILAIAFPFLFKIISLNDFRNVSYISQGEGGDRQKKLFIFLLFNIVVFLLMMVLIRLPYVARAYVPVTILMIICGVLGLLISKKVSMMRPFILCFLCVIILVQAFHYRYLTSSFGKDVDLQDMGVAINTVKLETQQEIIKYLFNLYHLQNIKKIYFRPLVWNFNDPEILNCPIYQFFINLIDKGLPAKKIKSTDSRTVLYIYINENIFYQLLKKKITDIADYALLNINIAKIFDPYSYYIFELEDVLNYIDK